MKNTAKLLALLLALVMVLSLTACGGSKTDSSAPAASSSAEKAPDKSSESKGGEPTGDKTTEVTAGSGKVLNGGFYLNETWIGSFDPSGVFVNGVCFGITYMLYDAPLFASANGFVSRIFSDYGWDDDGVTFVATIKDNVCFNNGDPMTPEDIIYSYQFIQGSWMAGWYSFIDLENSYGEGQTLYLKTLYPYAAADSYLDVAIFNQDVLEARLAEVGGDTTAIDSYALEFQDGLCSGPYRCVESVNDSHAVYELREDWWGYEEYGTNMPSQLNAFYYADQTTMGIDLQNGKIDMALNVALTDAQRANNGEYGDIKLGLSPQNGIWYAAISELQPRMQDLNLRRAMVSSINREEMTSLALDLQGRAVDCFFPTTTEGYIGGTMLPYDPDAAKDFLAASNYDGQSIMLLLDTDITATTFAEAFQYYCADTGIVIDLTIVDSQSTGSITAAGGVDMQLGHTGMNPAAIAWKDLNNFSSPVSRAPDFNYEGRTELMELYNNAKYSSDFDYRVEQYHAIAKYMNENVLNIPFAEYDQAWLYNSTVIDYENSFLSGFIQPDTTQIALY